MSLALITGASSGIGAAFADALARRGWDLMLVARRADRLQAMAADLGARHSVKCEVLAADISSNEGRDVVAARIRALPRLDLLVNNAGFATTGRLAKIDVQEQLEMLRLHVLAPMALSHAALPGMIAQHGGAIINVASVAGFMYGPGNVNYSASKAFLINFTKGLDTEIRGSGVKLQVLCPGFTHTEIHDRMPHVKQRIASWLWMTAEETAEISLRQLERGGGITCVPGFKNKLIVFLVKRVPHSLRTRLAVRKSH